MPAYALPGTEVGPRRARVLGACAIVLTVLGVTAWRVLPEREDPADLHVALLVSQVGEGVAAGTDVRLDGVQVGSVGGIESAGAAGQRIELRLNRSQLFGLTNSMTVDYVPGNLFGISAVELHPNAGGSALTDGTTVDLTADPGGVRDATLAALLKSTGRLTGEVLTPELSDVLAKVSHDVSAFTPLLRALGATARAFAETQQLPPDLLFDRFGSVLTGLPPILTGGIDVLHASYANSYLQTPEHLARFGQMWSDVQNQLLPVATGMLALSRGYFAGLLPLGTLLLDQLSGSISTPEQSAQQLSELLTRLTDAFHETPDGPELNLAVELDVAPGLAGPLADLLATSQGGH
ncbi:MlaD family protein [Nocardia sp. NBC_00511]|uniref:MlaD family protein n=1 Tax=Nocardia sp. NBC_00511 TaxID=2903591 RepID=UPI0030DF1C13